MTNPPRSFGGIQAVWAATLLVSIFCTLASNPLTGDTWWTITTGHLLAETRALPDSYPFTFAPQSSRFVDAQWLAQLVFYAPFPLLGLGGVAVLNALLVTVSFGLLLVASRRTSKHAGAATGATAIGAALTISNAAPRAQTLGFLFFAMSLFLLLPTDETDNSSASAPSSTGPSNLRWRIFALFAIEVCWANSHGSFFLGPLASGLLLAAYAVEHLSAPGAILQRARFLGAVLGAQVVATFFTPFGLGLYDYVIRLASHPIIRTIVTEWRATTATNGTGVLFFISLPVVAACLLRSRRPVSLGDLVILLPFMVLGFQAIRNVAWWGLVLPAVLSPYLAQLLPRRQTSASHANAERVLTVPLFNAMMFSVLALLVLSSLPWTKDWNPLTPEEKRGLTLGDDPQAAADFLAREPACKRIFTVQHWGGYLNWRLEPKCKSFVDGPTEVYALSVWDDYFAITQGREEAIDLLNSYRVDTLVLSTNEQRALIGGVQRSEQWSEVFHDDLAIVFQRNLAGLE